MDPARIADLELCLAKDLIVERGYYEVMTNRVVIQAGLSPGLAQAVYVHELRHLHQNELGICPTVELAMGDYAQAVLAMEADASVVSLVTAWRLRTAGIPFMWEALANWPMQQDLVAVFKEVIVESGDPALAASGAFEQWYKSKDRRQAYYISVCSDYLDRLEEAHLMQRYNTLSPQFFVDLCILPDGTRYSCSGEQ